MSTRDYSAPRGYSQVLAMGTLSVVIHLVVVCVFKAHRKKKKKVTKVLIVFFKKDPKPFKASVD